MAIDEQAMRASAEAYCEHVRGLRLKMLAAQAAYEEQRAALDGIKAVRYDRVGKTAPTGGDDAMLGLVERMEAAGDGMVEAMAEWARECDAFDAACRQLQPQSSYVLAMRYRNGARWGEIASRMRYSPEYVRGSVKAAALLELYPLLPLSWK